jgi:hypothetical protein
MTLEFGIRALFIVILILAVQGCQPNNQISDFYSGK